MCERLSPHTPIMQVASLVLACCSCALAIGLLVALILCRQSSGSKSCSIAQYTITACIVTATLLNIIFAAVSKNGASVVKLSPDSVSTATVGSAPVAIAQVTPAPARATPCSSQPLDVKVEGEVNLPLGIPVDLQILIPSTSSDKKTGKLKYEGFRTGSLPMLKYEGFRIRSVDARAHWDRLGYAYSDFVTDDEADLSKMFGSTFILDESRYGAVKQVVYVGYTENTGDPQRAWKFKAIFYDKAHNNVSTVTLVPDATATIYLVQPLPLKQMTR